MGFREINDWPYFKYKTKHYLCLCNIGDGHPFILSRHCSVTHVHESNGNHRRHWHSKNGNTRERGPNNYNKGIWCMEIDSNWIELSVIYIEPEQLPFVPVDMTFTDSEAGSSARSEKILALIQRRLI